MIELIKCATKSQNDIAKDIIENHHSYVPTYKSVGRRIDYLIYNGEDLIGMIGIGSSTYPPCKDMLTYLGINKEHYRKIFNSFANNWRFCFTKRIKNCGTKVLRLMRERASGDWKEKYGDELNYLITFVGGGHDGAVYKADNWKMVGRTAGLPKHKSSSMKWNTGEELKDRFVKPTGENRKLIFLKAIKHKLEVEDEDNMLGI